MTLRAANVSSFARKSCGRVDLFFSHHALLMMAILLSDSCITGFGTGVVNSMVDSSILRIVPIWFAYSLNVLSAVFARSCEKMTSSTVTGAPSENFASRRIFTIHFVGATFSHDVASQDR